MIMFCATTSDTMLRDLEVLLGDNSGQMSLLTMQQSAVAEGLLKGSEKASKGLRRPVEGL